MPLMIHHLLRELEEARGRPVTLGEIRAHARDILPMAEANALRGLTRLAGAGLVDRIPGEGVEGDEGEAWRTRMDAPVEVMAARHPDLYNESFFYFLISQKIAGRPLPPQEVIRILREVAGGSRKMPAVADILHHLDARAAGVGSAARRKIVVKERMPVCIQRGPLQRWPGRRPNGGCRTPGSA
jgi:hypothetical protein